eukprot:TRINITY_DN10601_c0_g1_i1.p1 TRINITY_DN10601_c0_g1~~TRINITY_DN10601_c0_g1_i1.p1  ORF type:complete len:213 (+),score=7.49 TRINITY_DN10601_c0_g1_i1:527-1165(+)
MPGTNKRPHGRPQPTSEPEVAKQSPVVHDTTVTTIRLTRQAPSCCTFLSLLMIPLLSRAADLDEDRLKKHLDQRIDGINAFLLPLVENKTYGLEDVDVVLERIGRNHEYYTDHVADFDFSVTEKLAAKRRLGELIRLIREKQHEMAVKHGNDAFFMVTGSDHTVLLAKCHGKWVYYDPLGIMLKSDDIGEEIRDKLRARTTRSLTAQAFVAK